MREGRLGQACLEDVTLIMWCDMGGSLIELHQTFQGMTAHQICHLTVKCLFWIVWISRLRLDERSSISCTHQAHQHLFPFYPMDHWRRFPTSCFLPYRQYDCRCPYEGTTIAKSQTFRSRIGSHVNLRGSVGIAEGKCATRHVLAMSYSFCHSVDFLPSFIYISGLIVASYLQYIEYYFLYSTLSCSVHNWGMFLYAIIILLYLWCI